uniref:Cystatin domain-containing protein n=2 Tax=Castor canadensis TaxID=51338 RepID=A0A8C0WBD1_CASCN
AEMEVSAWRIPLLLLLALVMETNLASFQGWSGFQEKPMSTKNMNTTLDFFIQSYNNASNDTYLFQVQELIGSQVQLTTGVEYLVTVKIARTKCKRDEVKNVSCSLQNNKLKRTLVCTSLVYTVPWMDYYQLWDNSCKDV